MRSISAAFYLLTTLLLISFTRTSLAGELILNNGDRLQGSLIRVSRSTLTWKSDSFGRLTIDKLRVADLLLEAPVKIQGQKDTCFIDGMEGHFLKYRCGGRNRGLRTELLTLDSVLPYEDFAAVGHTYGGKMALSGTFSQGNKVEEDLDLEAGITYRLSDFRHVMEIDYESKSVNNEPSKDDYELSYRLDWFFDERWFWYNELRYGTEESKNINERYALGSGLGVQLWENTNTAMALESGFNYVREEFELTDADLLDPTWKSSQERPTWRFATKFRYKLPFSATLIHTHEVLYSLSEGGDWEVSADLGLNVPLGPGLFSEYKFEYDYDNIPANETSKEDTKFTVGVGYEW